VDAVSRIARTVLYEGHVLWPYRRSALKNQERWTFGRLYPEAHHAEGDASMLQVQALLEAGAGARVTLRLRFLQLVERRVSRNGETVDALEIGGRRHLAWDEATEREVVVDDVVAGAPAFLRTFEVPAGCAEEPLADEAGVPVAALVRTWCPLRGLLELATEAVAPGLVRLTARVVNTTPWTDEGGRLLASTFLSTHVVLEAERGRFVSLQDPPEPWREAAAACRNVGTWPVLVGAPGEHATLLAAPIVLYDHPQIAPESPGDFFDATEIDEMLVLNVLALTDEERRDMAASDPRAREIAERCASMSVDDVLRLHGAIRDRRPLGEA